jgi:transcriptional regulator with XRE-family HTH domain
LSSQRRILFRMADDVVYVLARNLKRFMDEGPAPISQNALARKSKVAQTSIGYMLNPQSRSPTKSGKRSSPTVAKLERVAAALGKEAWQLLHPNPDQAPLNETERARYAEFQASMKRMRALDESKLDPTKPVRS